MDFKVVGNVVFFLKLAKEASIPVFNLHKDDAIDRLKEYINSIVPNDEI